MTNIKLIKVTALSLTAWALSFLMLRYMIDLDVLKSLGLSSLPASWVFYQSLEKLKN